MVVRRLCVPKTLYVLRDWLLLPVVMFFGSLLLGPLSSWFLLSVVNDYAPPYFFPFPFSLPLLKLQLLVQVPVIHHLILPSSLQDRYCIPSWKRGTIKRIIQALGPRAGEGMVKGRRLSQGWAPSAHSSLQGNTGF